MSEMKLKLTGQCLNRTGNFLVTGSVCLGLKLLQSIIYRVQTGGLGGSAQSDFMAF